jgi:hypothetical protein
MRSILEQMLTTGRETQTLPANLQDEAPGLNLLENKSAGT